MNKKDFHVEASKAIIKIPQKSIMDEIEDLAAQESMRFIEPTHVIMDGTTYAQLCHQMAEYTNRIIGHTPSIVGLKAIVTTVGILKIIPIRTSKRVIYVSEEGSHKFGHYIVEGNGIDRAIERLNK